MSRKGENARKLQPQYQSIDHNNQPRQVVVSPAQAGQNPGRQLLFCNLPSIASPFIQLMKQFLTHAFSAALVLLCGSASVQAQAPALATFPVGAATVTVSQLSTGLDIVWELAWGPDNFIWATERAGRISRINPTTGQVLPLHTLPDVWAQYEGGLLGMALHPQFATSPYVYVVYNYAASTGYREKLVRLTYNAAANTLSNPTVLLADIPANWYHNGSRLLILPDLTLLMTTGDAGATTEAQNSASLSGKLLRMNLDGSIPADNPTPGSYVYSLGHRNPQGLVRLPSGRIYSSEHGPSNDDEINLIEPGRNFGWPNVEGFCNLPAEAAFCASNNVREPLVNWTPTVAPAGLTYYNHPAIPDWQGSLLLACLNGNRLVHMPLSATGDAITSRTNYLTTFGRLRALCVSPQGKIYVGTSNGGNFTDRILVLENRAFMGSGTRSSAALSFSVAPNPAQQRATLQLPAPGLRISLRDPLGREVRALVAPATTASIDLSGVASGLYIVQVQGPAGQACQQLVVE